MNYGLLAQAGRNEDSSRFGGEVAHLSRAEADLLKSLGGAGTINPVTGLREYGGVGTGQGTASPGPGSMGSFGLSTGATGQGGGGSGSSAMGVGPPSYVQGDPPLPYGFLMGYNVPNLPPTSAYAPPPPPPPPSLVPTDPVDRGEQEISIDTQLYKPRNDAEIDSPLGEQANRSRINIVQNTVADALANVLDNPDLGDAITDMPIGILGMLGKMVSQLGPWASTSPLPAYTGMPGGVAPGGLSKERQQEEGRYAMGTRDYEASYPIEQQELTGGLVSQPPPFADVAISPSQEQLYSQSIASNEEWWNNFYNFYGPEASTGLI